MAKSERSEEIQVIPEQSRVGEHQSNGEIERNAQTLEGQIRCMLLALESRNKSKIREDHPIMHWLIKHDAMLISLVSVGEDGRTAYERRKGRKFFRTPPEIGECIMYPNPKLVGKGKMDSRWEHLD